MRFASKLMWSSALAGAGWCGGAQAQNPVKVFILAGQSNMEGKGQVAGASTPGTLENMVVTDPANFGHLVSSGTNNWITRGDVQIASTTGSNNSLISGGLTVGFGSSSNQIGPELGFGWEMGDLYGEDVLIIKTAWGGKSLAVDFISPTAAAKRGRAVGAYYNETLAVVDSVLSNIGSYVPGYSGQGYELQGFGWHQGWNDRVNNVFVSEYEANMVDFINDMRFDLGASDLPFVIANTGIGGAPLSGGALTLANAQLGPANLTLAGDQIGTLGEVNYPEFLGNVMAVNTIPFWRDASDSPVPSGSQGFHWNQSGETMYLIGEAMGQAMATMSSYEQFERAYLSVDLQSGEIKIVNPASNVQDMDLEAYTITSARGALDINDWTPIAGHYDGAGDGSVDSGNWTINAGSTTQLGESADAGGADGLVAIGSEVSLGVGAWIQNLVPDVQAMYTDTDGTVITLNIRYVGEANILGDLTTDGSIDISDWAQFVAGVQADMSLVSEAQAYQLGDLDGDFDNDIDDFDLFRKAFELANPEPGAFQQMLLEYSVPEPGSLVLLAGGALLGLKRRRRDAGSRTLGGKMQHDPKQRHNRSVTQHKNAAAVLGLVFLAGSAGAQEMFSVNLWSIGKPSSPSVWVDTPSNTQTLTLEAGEAAGLWETTDWQNINFGNPFTSSTSVTTITGSSGSTATFSMPQRRNSSPFYWNAVRNDADAVHIGNATLLDGHAAATEDPYDGSATAILEVTNIPFAVYDVVIYLGINDGQKYNGKGTVDFEGSVQSFTMPTTEPNGTLTRILDAVTPGNYLLYEQVTGSSFTAEIFGEAFTHLGPAGFQIREVVDPAELTLQVDTQTGAMLLKGDDSDPKTINYYQVTSAGGSLNPAGWNSLADQDFDGNGPANGSGNGWEEGGGVSNAGLAEAYLLGDSVINAGADIHLGSAYNTAINAQDLVFRYRSDTGQSFYGVVEYVTGTLPGDTDGDGDIDDADLGTSFSNYTGPIGGAGNKTAADGDTDGDGDVDDGDLGLSFSNYTGPLAPSVPEPASAAMLSLGLLAMRRRRGDQ